MFFYTQNETFVCLRHRFLAFDVTNDENLKHCQVCTLSGLASAIEEHKRDYNLIIAIALFQRDLAEDNSRVASVRKLFTNSRVSDFSLFCLSVCSLCVSRKHSPSMEHLRTKTTHKHIR